MGTVCGTTAIIIKLTTPYMQNKYKKLYEPVEYDETEHERHNRNRAPIGGRWTVKKMEVCLPEEDFNRLVESATLGKYINVVLLVIIIVLLMVK